MKEITLEKLEKYVSVTKKAIDKAEASSNRTSLVKEREDCFDMIKRYFSDALHFKEKGDLSAHNPFHTSVKRDLELIQPKYRHLVQELFYKAGILK